MSAAARMENWLRRIQAALDAAVPAIAPYVPGAVAAEQKSGGRGPVTEADRVANTVLRECLLRDGEGWLSEESADNPERLTKSVVWVVDPLDGTLEFVAGIPEWCISVALIVEGEAVAGGICNPARRETFVGSRQTGLLFNGQPANASSAAGLEGAVVLASRSEVKRGEWERFRHQAFQVIPMGSVAYKLARVAAGLAHATWTLTPKHEWDVAAGVALVESAGGVVRGLDGKPLRFNNRSALLTGLIACGPNLLDPFLKVLQPHLPTA